MKKVFCILLLLLFMIVTSPVARADFEIDGGISYNTLNLKSFNSYLDSREERLNEYFEEYFEEYYDFDSSFADVEAGSSYFLTGDYIIGKKTGVGAGIERFSTISADYGITTEYSEIFSLDLTGYLARIKYLLVADEGIALTAGADAGRYMGNLNYSREYDFETEEEVVYEIEEYSYGGSAWGGKAGLTLGIDLSDDVFLFSQSNYRFLTLKSLENSGGEKFYNYYEEEPLELDFSGYEFGAGLRVAF
ncbi:MAG: hypothetical protein ACOCQC_03765 [Halanaerobiaceae bacterium]